MSIEFVNEPPRTVRRESKFGDYVAFVEALKARPGEWAIFAKGLKRTDASSCAQYLKERYGVEAISRNLPDTQGTVYARYVNGNGK